MKSAALRKGLTAFFGAATLAFGLAGQASASPVIDTTGAGGSTFTCLGMAPGCGQTFGQSFTVTGAETRLDSFGFNVTPVAGGSLAVVLRIFGWDGNDRTGSQLFASSTTTLTQTVKSFVNFSVELDLIPNGTYMAYLDTAGLGNSTSQSSGFYYADGSTYGGGSFNWERTSGDNNWFNGTSYDSEFRATFSAPVAVPEPASLALVGLALAGLGLSRRKAA